MDEGLITYAEHLAATNVRSRVTYPLPRNHRLHRTMAVEVTEKFAHGEVPGRSNGLYAIEYPEPIGLFHGKMERAIINE